MSDEKIKLADGDSVCPFEKDFCPGFGSDAAIFDLCDECYMGRIAEGEKER